MPALKVTLIGAGRMGSALASGWLNAASRPDLSIVDPNPNDAVRLWGQLGNVTLNGKPKPADILVLSLKPQVFLSLSDQLKGWVGPETLVISIMAGITLQQLRTAFSTERVVRAMPNTPGAVAAGVTVLSTPFAMPDTDIDRARALLKPLGLVEGPVKEDALSIVTALSGSGPAYVFLLADSMAKAAIAAGLDETLANRLARETVIGSAVLLQESEDTPEELRQAVTSPGGVTAAALSVLMGEAGLPNLMETAIAKGVAREKALSGND